MFFIVFLNSLIFTELGVSLYTFLDIKDATYGDVNTDKTRKISITSLIILLLLIILINSLFIFEIINRKRTIINLILLNFIISVFFYINFMYLYLQRKSAPNYQSSLNDLESNSENINKTIKNINLIVATVILFFSCVALSFFIGYYYFSRVEIKKVYQPVISGNNKKNKLDKLNLF